MRVHQISDCVRQALVDAVKVLAQLFKLHCECLLIIRHVQVSSRRSVDKIVLLPDCEHVPFKTKFLKGFVADTTDFDALCPSNIRVDFAEFVEYVTDFNNLLIAVTVILIA